MNKISFIKSNDRFYNIQRAFSLIKSEIISGIKDAKRVVVKPNCVTDSVKLASTHVDALNAVLDFIRPYVSGQITLAEGSAVGDTIEAFKNFGYLTLQTKYDLALADLNRDDYIEVPLIDRNEKIFNAKFSKTIAESDYLISVSPPKTHNAVVYAGAVKNIAVGSLIRETDKLGLLNKIFGGKDNKQLIHQGYRATNENIRRLANYFDIKLAVLDGFEAMQGNGPVNGELVPAHFAIASSNALSSDALACKLMGININDVGYLSLLGADLSDSFVIGDDPEKNIISFKMHSDFEKMRQWR